MKIEITINADYTGELNLIKKLENVKNELSNTLYQFVSKDTVIEFETKEAEIDVVTGELVNYNPYPVKFYNFVEDEPRIRDAGDYLFYQHLIIG